MKITVDRSGFPMIHVDSIGAFVHFFPFTKLQVEDFIADTPNIDFNEDWYKSITENNARVSIRETSADNFFGLFATALLPTEVDEWIADWHGTDFRMPTVEEWKSAFRELRDVSYDSTAIVSSSAVSPIAVKLIERIEQLDLSGGSSDLASGMLFSMGVLELTRGVENSNDYKGLGRPFPRFRSINKEPDEETPLRDVMNVRNNILGFRLLKTDG